MNQEVDLASLRAYCGEYKGELLETLYNDLETQAAGITVIPNVKNELNVNKLTMESGLKPFTGDYVPRKKTGKYTEKTLKVAKVQRDDRIFPSEYLPTWMAQQRGKGENPNNTKIPFEQHFWESYMRRNSTDLNLEQLYWGVDKSTIAAWSGAATYAIGDIKSYTQDGELRYFRAVAATAAAESPDTHPAKWAWAGHRVLGKGYNQLIKDGITATEAKTVATGTIVLATAYDQFQSVYRALPEPVKIGRYGKVVLECSMNSYELLTDDYENKIKKNFEEVDGIVYLAKTNRNCIVSPRMWLTGSGRLIARVPNNFWLGTDQEADMNTIKQIDEMYSVQVGMSFMWGQLISNFEFMAVNTND
jgi:hypothetical protein